MKVLLPIAAALLIGSLCLADFANAQAVPEKVTPTELLTMKDLLTNKSVTVEGTLTNAGTNYFSDLRLMLKENKDSSEGVLVQPWLPMEMPVARPVGSKLSDYLGRKVRIQGVLTDSVIKNVGRAKVLRVDSALIID